MRYLVMYDIGKFTPLCKHSTVVPVAIVEARDEFDAFAIMQNGDNGWDKSPVVATSLAFGGAATRSMTTGDILIGEDRSCWWLGNNGWENFSNYCLDSLSPIGQIRANASVLASLATCR